MATEQTRHEAADPQTTPARLQELTIDPELWPLIAANPAAYDSLVAWLGENGGDDVRAAIASRWSAPAPAGFAHQAPGPTAGHSRSSNKGLWITLSVLLFLLLSGGVGTGVWALTRDDDSSTSADEDTKKEDSGDDRKTDTETDTDRDDDEKKDDDSKKDDEIDCDDLSDFEDAADDLTYYFPDLDDEDMLTDAVEVIEQYEDHDDQDLAAIADDLLAYAEEIADDPDAIVGPEWSAALDAKLDLADYVFEEC